MNRNTISTSGQKKPSWWSPKSGLLLAAGFGIVAAWPFISSATKLAAAGEQVTVNKVVQGAKEEKERYEKMEPEKYRELKAFVETADGTAIVGTKGGIFLGKNGTWSLDEGFGGGDVKDLALGVDGSVWAASKKGVYKRNASDGKWEASYGQEAHSVTVNASGEVFVTSKAGVFKRGSEGKWTTVLAELPANALPAEVLQRAAEEKKNEKGKEREHGRDKEKVRGEGQAGKVEEEGRADG